MSPAPPLVVAQSLSRAYVTSDRQFAAVERASFVIEAGARIAVVGPSGSGKSTLLQLIAGLDVPSSGSISWPAQGNPARLRPTNISMVFQSNSLIASLDATENVMLALALAGAREDAVPKAESTLRRFALEASLRKLPSELSGGQAARVALARGLVTNPRLLIADEPTGQLDRATATSVMSQLLAWADQSGGSLLIATHDEQVAMRLDSIWRIESGRLCTEDGP